MIDLIGIRDLLDVVIVGALLWGGLVWLRRTRARLAIPALLIVAAVYLAAELAIRRRILPEVQQPRLDGISFRLACAAA